MVHQQKNEFCEEGRMKKAGTEAKNEREREAGSKKLFPGFILTEMLKTFSFTGMNKTLNNEQDEQE